MRLTIGTITNSLVSLLVRHGKSCYTDAVEITRILGMIKGLEGYLYYLTKQRYLYLPYLLVL